MKHFRYCALILAALVAGLTAVAGPFDSFAKYDVASISGRELVYNTLKGLRGDTITMNFSSTVSGLDCFSKNEPDTVWIKKRPKKNPELNKHYILNYTYRSRPNASGVGYYTPADSVNGRQFVVASVEKTNSDNFDHRSGITLRLVDLDGYDMLSCLIPETYDSKILINSSRVDREIEQMKGRSFYYSRPATGSGSYYSRPASTGRPEEVTVQDGRYAISLPDGCRLLKSSIVFTLKTKDGELLDCTPSKMGTCLTREQYIDRYGRRLISSAVDSAVVNSPLKMPFSFPVIFATVSGYSVPVSQDIDPSRLSGREWGQATLSNGQQLFLGHSININGEKFYRAALNRKAFFIRAKDVKVVSGQEACLDSLERSSDEVKKKFFQTTLLLSDYYRNNSLSEASKVFDRFDKAGIGVVEWSVYDESEYTDGTSARVSFYNPTKSMIKYVTFKVQGYNAVDDPVGAPITRKCIGPIEPGEVGTYNFDYLWFTDIVDYALIKSITVQYKNGSTRSVTDVSRVMAPDDFDEIVASINASDPVEKLQ